MRLIVVLCLLAFAPAAATAAEPAAHPLDREVRLSVWGASLNDAAREIHAQTGVEIRYYLPDLPATANTDNVFLVTGKVPLGAAMEALAHRFGFRYRVTEAGGIECSRGYDWIGVEPTLAFPRMRPLVDGGHDALRKFLGELIKPVPLLPGEYSLSLETYPLPNQPDAIRATAVLPPVLADYLQRAVRCLEGDGGDYPLASGRPESRRIFARAAALSTDWGELLGRPLSMPRGSDARDILADAARQTGVAIVLTAPPAPGNRELPFDIQRYSLGKLTETLSESWGLGRRVFLAGGAVVFERGGGDYETDARSRQLFWNGLAVAGFDARRAAGQNGEALMAALRREVFPGVWRDPVCAMQYSPLTGRLAVVAPYNVIEAVAARLAAMER